MSAADVNVDGYVLQRSSAEYQRLSKQALLWEPATRQAIARTGLAAGMSALDIGCGTGAVMRLMGEVVGAQGQVVGVDGDGRLGREAVQLLSADGPDIYRFVEADVTKVESIEGQQFDLVFARLLVVHMPDPIEALRRFWSWVKPGGSLLIMDLDLTVTRYFPHSEVLSHASDLFRTLVAGLGKDVEIGARMPELCRRAGIGVPESCDVASMVKLMEAGGGNLRAALASVREGALAKKLVDVETLDATDARLSATPANQTFGRWYDLIGTWKRKPS